ncbi:CMD domain protein [uncultured Pseudomonas sp.]|uniref:CMD domain-containing protein n=1 Tax=uncultured Pseudomonas sp. TaxID=114707 RepID=UPI0025D09B85|nr:CMD domain protein [uncultured Pseudomonas sp.]
MSSPANDLIDSLVLQADSHLREVRQARSKVTLATQASHELLFAADLPGSLSVETRLLVALYGSLLSRQAQLAAYYRQRLVELNTAAVLLAAVEQDHLAAIDDLLLRRVLGYTRTLILAPKEGDRAALDALREAGLSPLDAVTLAQLIAFISYQVRLTAGLAALQALGAAQ